MLTRHVPGSAVWDVTLTVPGEVTPDQWDKLKRRYFKRLERAGLAGVWRVELQRRGQPHLHLAIWGPNITQDMSKRDFERATLITRGWFDCLPKRNREVRGARAHAVHCAGPFSDVEQSPRWFAYLAGHASKHKQEQLGWKGKQWGILSRRLFVEREPLAVIPMPEKVDAAIRRTLSRYLHQQRLTRWRNRGFKGSRPRRWIFRKNLGFTRFIDPQVIAKIGMWAATCST